MSAGKFTLTVKNISPAGKDAVQIAFQKPEGFVYKPGQFLTFNLPDLDEGFMRSYSLSSSPFTSEDLVVGVRKVGNGKISTYFNHNVKVGDKLDIIGPAGTFTTTINVSAKRHVVLFAAGSGITPILSILKSILIMEQETKVALIYANRTEDWIMFKEELKSLESQYAGRFQLINVLSQPDSSWVGLSGRIDKDMAIRLVEQVLVFPKQAEYYLCGPDGFMEEIKSALKLLQIPASQVLFESFGTTTHALHVPESADSDSPSEVTIRYRKNTYTLSVPKNQTILSVAKAEGVRLPHSCENGICSACIGKCISGQVTVDEDQAALTDNDLKKGYILTCVGFATSDKVELEID